MLRSFQHCGTIFSSITFCHVPLSAAAVERKGEEREANVDRN